MCGKAQIVTKMKLQGKKIQTNLTLNCEEEKLKLFYTQISDYLYCDKTHLGTQLKLRQQFKHEKNTKCQKNINWEQT